MKDGVGMGWGREWGVGMGGARFQCVGKWGHWGVISGVVARGVMSGAFGPITFCPLLVATMGIYNII